MNDPQAIHSLASALAMWSITGSGIAIGMIGKAALDGIARNPEAYDKIFIPMIMAFAFAEALAIYALVIALR